MYVKDKTIDKPKQSNQRKGRKKYERNETNLYQTTVLNLLTIKSMGFCDLY